MAMTMTQTVKTTPYWFTTEFEGEEYIRYYDTFSELMHTVVRTIAFNDCTEETVVNISADGNIIHYTGWKPGRHYVFKNMDGEVVWDDYYPEYDH